MAGQSKEREGEMRLPVLEELNAEKEAFIQPVNRMLF